MRVVAGSAKSLKLKTIEGMETRPTQAAMTLIADSILLMRFLTRREVHFWIFSLEVEESGSRH